MTLEGAPWFVGSDVVNTLGLHNGGSNYGPLAVDEKRRADPALVRGLNSSKNGTGERGVHLKTVTLVSESGLYKLIMRSDKPVAKPFQDWVTREVIPSIRKTGGYQLGAGETMPLPGSFTDALRQHAATSKSRIVLRHSDSSNPPRRQARVHVCRPRGLLSL